jgi:hypothetical protein
VRPAPGGHSTHRRPAGGLPALYSGRVAAIVSREETEGLSLPIARPELDVRADTVAEAIMQQYAQTRWMWSRLARKLRRRKGSIPATTILTQNCGFQLSLPLSAKGCSLLNQYPAIYHLECYLICLVLCPRIVALCRVSLDSCCTTSVNAQLANQYVSQAQ